MHYCIRSLYIIYHNAVGRKPDGSLIHTNSAGCVSLWVNIDQQNLLAKLCDAGRRIYSSCCLADSALLIRDRNYLSQIFPSILSFPFHTSAIITHFFRNINIQSALKQHYCFT